MSGPDVAIVGLGVMGSAIACELARRNLQVVAFERWWSAHDRGSSHGDTRLFRQAHFEHPDYVPLARSAYEGWRALEQQVNRQLFMSTGALVTGPAKRGIVERVRNAADAHRVPYEYLTTEVLGERYPWLAAGRNDVGLLETSAGILLADDCVASLQEAAVKAGAELRFGTSCELHTSASGQTALIANGETIDAKRIVVAAGPWASQVLPSTWIPPLVVERTVSYWFSPNLDHAQFEAAAIPPVLWDHPKRPMLVFPDTSGLGVKVNFQDSSPPTTPQKLDQIVTLREREEARSQVAAAAPAIAGELVDASACMYTNTRDGNFAIGYVGEGAKLMLVSACSGHGFKFAPVVGEIVAELLVEGATRHPTDLFRLDRPALYPESEFSNILRSLPPQAVPLRARTDRRRRR